MLIGEAPGQREDDSGRPFVGRAGMLLDTMLADAGLSRSDLYITNAVHCRPPGNRTPTKREIKACQHWLNYELATVKPKVVGILGGVALLATLGLKGITKIRGRPIERDGIVYLPMLHPSYILRRDCIDQPTGEQDFRTLKGIIDFGGVPEEQELNPTLVDTWAKVDQMIGAMHGVVSADIETTCLYPWAAEAKVVMLGVGTSSGEFDVPAAHKDSPWSQNDLAEIVERITAKLEDCFTVFQGGKFDCLWMRVHYGVEWHNDFDTLLAHYLIDENSHHDLEFLARLYFGAPNWDIPLEEKQGNTSLKVLGKYHAHDLFYTRRLYFKLKRELDKDPQVRRVFTKLLMPVSNLFVKMEERGCFIDADKMDNAEVYLRHEMAMAHKKLIRWGDINWASPKQVGELLYSKLKIKCPQKTKKGALSTSESTLNQINHPVVVDLIKFRGHKQQLSFFVEGWRPFIVNDRIHPSFKLHGTVTGRPSCTHPNFQQVPRDARIRSQIITSKGWELIEADLSQIEMRLAAESSHDPEMMQCFQFGIDIHWRTLMSSLESGAAYVDEVKKTVEVYCMQQGLSADGPSASILLKVWTENKGRSETQKLLEKWKTRPSSGISEEAEKNLLRALREYSEAVRTTSQKRKPQGREAIKFSDAMQLLSYIGPSRSIDILPDFWPEKRKLAKSQGFGFLFGMAAKKFVQYSRDSYGIIINEVEAQKGRKHFFSLYSSLEPWHRKQQRFAREHGFVRTFTGRKRRLPHAQDRDDTYERAEAWRQAINSPIQGTASDLNLMVLLQLAEEFPHVYPTITVHDSILVEVPTKDVERVVLRLEEIMKGPQLLKAFDIKFSVPICGEVKVGPWGSGVSLDKWRKHE